MLKKVSNFLRKSPFFFLLLIISPGFWWIIFQPVTVFSELVKFPVYARHKVNTIFSTENLRFIEEMRWNAFGEQKEELISRAYFNKATVLINNSFEYLSLASPRIYFQAGDGTSFSPPKAEPIPAILFIFWVFGLIELIKKKEKRPLYLFLLFSFFAFLAGVRNFAFLFPILILYIYISSIGMEFLLGKSKKKNLAITLLMVYGVFIIGRALWLVY